MKRKCLLCLALLLEPLCHAFGIPHPEGLSQIVLNHMANE